MTYSEGPCEPGLRQVLLSPPRSEHERWFTYTKAKVLGGLSKPWPVKNCFFPLKLTMASVFPWQLCCFSSRTIKRKVLFSLSTRSASALYSEPWIFVRKRSITTGKHFLKASWQVTGDHLTQKQTDPIFLAWKNATKAQKSMKIQAWTNPQFCSPKTRDAFAENIYVMCILNWTAEW